MRRSRPVILLGAGARGADLERVLSWGIPILTSWPAKDMIDNAHALYFGSPGIYGQRAANKVLHHADLIVALGNRMSIWHVGHEGPRADQELVKVDIDPAEAAFTQSVDDFIATWEAPKVSEAWRDRCYDWHYRYPLHEPEPGTHDNLNGYINSYRFTRALLRYLADDEVIVTEMGAPLMAAHQILCLKPPQRLMTSGGLGEMGCGLPAAIGASFARGRGPVLCLSTDGGMMFNLQELQTIVHHQLPIRIIVYANGGYGMLKQTQENAGMQPSGVDADSGVSFPSFRHLALALGITASEIRTWADFERIIPDFMARTDGPQLIEYMMDPHQRYYPKIGYRMVDGKQVYDTFDSMSPKLEEMACA